MTEVSYINDTRTVMTLDAGGINFVFSAIKGGEYVVEPVSLPSNGNDLDKCLETLYSGFDKVKEALEEEPVAISFAFPGPADYPNGIIGDLNNLSGFRGGVPLKDILEHRFNIPVYINNDGDLYAYGEANAGILPEINEKLKKAGSAKQYHNLIGITLGTGFGSGIVRNGELYIGDNSTAAEVWKFSSRYLPNQNVEEGVSTRAIISYYKEHANHAPEELMPKDIYDIATGMVDGDTEIALEAFAEMGKVLGDTMANLMTYMDAIVVIGGGISGAKDLYMPAVLDQLNGKYCFPDGSEHPRLVQRIYNYDNDQDCKAFLNNPTKLISVPGTDKKIPYNPEARLAIAHSALGASKAIAIGAYIYALKHL